MSWRRLECCNVREVTDRSLDLETAMALVLFTSWFSPFARKAAIALELKGLTYQAIDALAREFRSELQRVNPRIEVPVLMDDEITVVNSNDILQYLDWRYPLPSLYPESIPDRVAARALERLADHYFDPIVVDCSFWQWADRTDEPPAGLIAAGQKDLETCFSRLENELSMRPKPWPFGSPGVVECSWFANLLAVKPMGFKIDPTRFPNVLQWLETMRQHPVFAADRKRTATFMKTLSSSTHERRRLFWSGDRIEWLLSRGFHDWFANEITSDRVAFPN
jgi:glutathione S-transferase